ncbi:MAG: RlmE family RNA methyltransferase [Gammaproteobacteria bacterium]|nr:RlmE family RNA methyltransferase [Gammaproteobacteria bacterium]MCH9743625.1 RlmE family RNA methyltransferase [Gammaproteobacteria bacterium]
MTNSRRWLDEHFKDEYVKKAQAEGYVSRAAYKLLELNEKDRFLKPGMKVLDLGAAPGGWSQVARQAVGAKGRVIAVDLLEMSPELQGISGVDVIQGDFTKQETLDRVLELLDGAPLDLVISDMAPNISGVKSVDQPRSVHLVELAFDCARQLLKPEGVFIAKAFQGEGMDILIKSLREVFKTVKFRKPKASRSRSSEVYLLARGLNH